MIAGLSGPLLSHDAIAAIVRSGAVPELANGPPGTTVRDLRAWHRQVRGRLGPSSPPRVVFDLIAEPLVRALGFELASCAVTGDTVDAVLDGRTGTPAVLVVTAWGQPMSAVWRRVIHLGLAHGARWSLYVNGPTVRVVDVRRPYARRYAEFALERTLDEEQSVAVLWALLHGAGMTCRQLSVLERVVTLCEQHRAQVRVSLREGVHDALLQLVGAFRRVPSSRKHADAALFHNALTVVYRIVFLLFAEARGLVPAWHPVYRDGYTIEALRRQTRGGAAPAGVWEALQAVARLAHRGCRAGTLRVPPFNGRLFSPADAPLAETAPLDDRSVAHAVRVLTTRRDGRGAEPISYADLGVEQLGSVYEHLLDYDIAGGTRGQPATLVPTGRRKATGSFYTPRSLTEFLVRRTLAPLVHDAPARTILDLRVLDPAMGSGAFLVAACRYLSSAYEQALVREGVLSANDVTAEDRAAFRRLIAQRCVFGVDVNPMAVQLGRLSLWLATLAANKPLSFLDHHLRAGNSLVGASVADLVQHRSPGRPAGVPRPLPLFPIDEMQTSLGTALTWRRSIAEIPDDSLEQVREKERTLTALMRAGGPLERWRAAADVWCAAWYPAGRQASGRAAFGALFDRIMHGSGALPETLAAPLLERARAVAAAQSFFHWPFEFPEAFCQADGRARGNPGFDAVVGNPPWEMLRSETGAARSSELQAFVRGSGIYALQGHGHYNLYQLFLERVFTLLRRGGRCGMILPSGFAIDRAAGPLRRHLFDRTSVDTFTTLDNRDGIFPIHRALRFLLLTCSSQGATTEVPARNGLRTLEDLDGVPDQGIDAAAIRVPRALIGGAGGGSLAVPDVRSPLDLEILSLMVFRHPALGDPRGWNVQFGRELNATDDRSHFRQDGRGLPVLEGKQLRPFAVDLRGVRQTILEPVAAGLLDPDATFGRARLAYRDVAAPTNRMTLIAAILPPGVVTTHTIFCLKPPLDDRSQQYLCGVFNSFVANYFVRMQVGTHVTAAILARLPVPVPNATDPRRRLIARLSAELARSADPSRLAGLNAAVAALYGLSASQFAHVLDTFPLMDEALRDATRAAARRELGP